MGAALFMLLLYGNSYTWPRGKQDITPPYFLRRAPHMAAAVLPPFLGKEMISYSRNAAASEDIVNRYHAPNLFREVFCADFTVTVHCIDDDAHMHNGRQYGSVVTQKML